MIRESLRGRESIFYLSDRFMPVNVIGEFLHNA